jgi:hypothetical protein
VSRIWRIVGQLLAYGAFVVVIAYLSSAPSYEHVNPEQAVLRLVISHATAKIGECRQLSPEEYAELPPNMRRATDCPRERHDLYIELLLDDKMLYRGAAPPTGLWRDGPSNVYRKFTVAPGMHQLLVRFRDSGRDNGFDQERAEAIELRPGQNFVVGFRSATGFQFGEG